MNFSLEIAQDRLSTMLPKYAEALEKSLPDAIRPAARGVTKRVLALTPPGSAGTTGRAAQRQGELRIERNLNRVFTPQVLKGHRTITMAWGHKMKTPVTVPAKELGPDVHAIYRQATYGTAGRIGLRALKMHYVVDVYKFDKLLSDKKAHVGRLASAWVSAALALEVPVPAWIARHGAARGAYRETMGTDKPFVEIAGILPVGVPASLGVAMDRLLAAAVNYQANAFTRQIRWLLAHEGVKSGFTHPAIMPPPPVAEDQAA